MTFATSLQMANFFDRKRPRLSRLFCVYCGTIATTRDHVPPKVLLDKPFPSNLRTVPSCKSCNNNASLDEQYLSVLLGEISSAPSINAKCAPSGSIYRTLLSSPALKVRIANALSVDNETGEQFIKPETHRVNRVLRKIAIGLFALRYGRIPANEEITDEALYPYSIKDLRPLPYFIATLTDRFRSKSWRKIQKGTFSYIFVRDPRQYGTVWCVIDFYQSSWGVVHFCNPKSAKIRINQQLELFSDDAT